MITVVLSVLYLAWSPGFTIRKGVKPERLPGLRVGGFLSRPLLPRYAVRPGVWPGLPPVRMIAGRDKSGNSGNIEAGRGRLICTASGLVVDTRQAI